MLGTYYYTFFFLHICVCTHVRRCNKRSDCAWINLKKRLLGSTAHSRRRGGALYVIISCIQFSAVFLVPSTSCWGLGDMHAGGGSVHLGISSIRFLNQTSVHSTVRLVVP
jgi:hypothetical protein